MHFFVYQFQRTSFTMELSCFYRTLPRIGNGNYVFHGLFKIIQNYVTIRSTIKFFQFRNQVFLQTMAKTRKFPRFACQVSSVPEESSFSLYFGKFFDFTIIFFYKRSGPGNFLRSELTFCRNSADSAFLFWVLLLRMKKWIPRKLLNFQSVPEIFFKLKNLTLH